MQTTANSYQHFLLDSEGYIIKSNNSFLSKEQVETVNDYNLLDFFKSIHPNILKELKANKMINFSGLQIMSNSLPGIYDFIFTLSRDNMESDKCQIDCWIIDRTVYYKDIQKNWKNYREESLYN